jgi:hypothetical protein
MLLLAAPLAAARDARFLGILLQLTLPNTAAPLLW